VVVATVRALKMQGGVAKSRLGREDAAAVARGVANLDRHVENMRKFGLPVVVALNRFTADTEAEIATVREAMAARTVEVIPCTHWADGGAGAEGLARAVLDLVAAKAARFAPLYPDAMTLAEKLRTVAREIYRAEDIALPPAAAKRLAALDERLPGLQVCVAKTQYSFSADPKLLGAPEGHILPVREVRLSAGAGFVVAICGDVMTMPGLPRRPAAESIRLDAHGRIEGLF
jgi:formate--tetrahydrofolate ligase